MKSVGEAMAIGRTFKESFHKAIRSLEVGYAGLDDFELSEDRECLENLWNKIEKPRPSRPWAIAEVLRQGVSVQEISDRSGIDPWFVRQIEELVLVEKELSNINLGDLSSILRKVKALGFSDARLAKLFSCDEREIRELRVKSDIHPVYKRVDTCGAEFEARTPYLYSTYEDECEAAPTSRRKILILGGGPNRIGQGIEFDYCCVHAAMALSEQGWETIMVNCNPETVSTDYDTSDRLYFEPLTLEDVLEVINVEKPFGVIVQYGGQTPLSLAVDLERSGVPILGTTPDAIDRAEDRERFDNMLELLALRRPPGGTARSSTEAAKIASTLGFPVLVRPSYVLGGRAMEIVHNQKSLAQYMQTAVTVSPEHPVLVDRFLNDAIEVDVDAVSDGEIVVIAGVLEHIEEAGVHSGDSACSLPPYSLSESIVAEIIDSTKKLALELGVKGLMNVQYAVKGSDVYVIEVNPRASRTVPFVSKAIGIPVAKLAARVMSGETLESIGWTSEIWPSHYSVKEAVFPFVKFPGVDTLLGPEMKSTGEVMGIDSDFGRAYAKAQIQAGNSLPLQGILLVSVKKEDHHRVVESIHSLAKLGFQIVATSGTAKILKESGLVVNFTNKVGEGAPDTVDRINSGEIDLVFNTVSTNVQAIKDSFTIRRAALNRGVPYFTTLAAIEAAAGAIVAVKEEKVGVRSLQEIHIGN